MIKPIFTFVGLEHKLLIALADFHEAMREVVDLGRSGLEVIGISMRKLCFCTLAILAEVEQI